MHVWLRVRTFLACFVLILGIGLMFGSADGDRLIVGALLMTVGLTVLMRLLLALLLVFWQK